MIEEWGREFRKFIKRKRQKQNITMEKLCEGICDVSTLCKIESGKYLPDKMLMDRILARLGISLDGYETYLTGEEYARWETRNRILADIIDEKMETAIELLEQYRELCVKGEKTPLPEERGKVLDYQFYLAMKGQIMAYRRMPEKELSQIYRDAVFLTMPNLLEGSFGERLLSIQELNLVLEWLRFGLADETPEQREGKKTAFEGILRYVEEGHLDQNSKAKLYPKAVFYYCKVRLQEVLDIGAMEELLELCEKGVEALRDDAKAYYFLELLWTKLHLLNRLFEQKKYKEQDFSVERLLKEIDETRQWTEVLTALYQKNGVRKDMYEYCYLYQEQDVYSIGDVTRTRREMLGMSRAFLSSGICSERTLIRIEKGEGKASRKTVGSLFERLGLSTEYQKYELESENPEAIGLMNELIVKQNSGRLEECIDILRQIRDIVPLRNPVNRQTLQRYEALCQWQAGKISKEEYKYRMLQALECTISRKKLFDMEAFYLSAGELLCIHNLTLAMTWKEDSDLEKYLGLLQKECARIEEHQGIYAQIKFYELWIHHLTSCLGNRGDYEASDKISLRSQKYSLALRRLNMSYMHLYNFVWNQEQKYKELYYSGNERKEIINACIILCAICRDDVSKAHFMRKLER